MDVTETDLPGVGKRFEVDIGDGQTAVVVVHNTGRRELFLRSDSEADAERLLDLENREARVVGSILEGAYFQPIASDTTQTKIGKDVMLEWYTLDESSPLVTQTLGEAAVRPTSGATVVTVERDDEVIQSPEPDCEFRAGDQLVVVGSQENHESFASEFV